MTEQEISARRRSLMATVLAGGALFSLPVVATLGGAGQASAQVVGSGDGGGGSNNGSNGQNPPVPCRPQTAGVNPFCVPAGSQ